MKKSVTKWIVALLAVAVLAMAALFAVAAVNGDVNGDGSVNLTDAVRVLQKLTGLSASDADANGDSATDLKDATAILGEMNAKGPKLASLSLDDGTAIAFAPDTHIYTVTLPDGRPRIPRVNATAAAGAEVTVYQATFADDQAEAMAKILVKSSAGESTYQVRFLKDRSAGFQLQYDDRYVYQPTAYQLGGGESFTFTSSDSSIASIDSKGTITAKAVSNTPVTITAKVNGVLKETLVIDKINKAQLSVFLIVGQSNAAGSSDSGVDREQEKKDSDKPTVGKAYCLDVAHTGAYATPYDLSAGRNGFAPSLSKTWYHLTGEKVLCIQSAVGGAPIENWEKGGDRYYGGSSSKNLYDNTLAAYTDYQARYAAADSNFEIIRTHYYWCQGETAMGSTWYGAPDYNWSFNIDKPANYIMTADDYYTRFTKIHETFVADMDVEVGGIMLVRCVSGKASDESKSLQLLTDLVPARAAQYALHNFGVPSLVIASRLCDIARMETSTDKVSPGWGYMGPANLHYLQRGYDAQGIELATNAFAMVNAYSDRTATDLEVIDTNGRTRFKDGEEIVIEAGKSKQITAIVLPLYAEDKTITYTVTEGASFCSIDKYGMITLSETATAGSKATIVIANGSGLKKTLNVKVDGAVQMVVKTFRWDFNGDLKETNSGIALVDGPDSTKAYTVGSETITITNSTTDFTLPQPIHLDETFDWSMEWRANQGSANCALFGVNGSTSNFVYLAHRVTNFGKPFRMVTGDGTAVMIPYGSYVEKPKTMSRWKAEYTMTNKTLTLYYYNEATSAWETVGSIAMPAGFTYDFTNLFGRYSTSANVNFKGEVDFVTITGQVESTGEVVQPTTELRETTFRWDFNGNLNEANGGGALVDGPKSTKKYTIGTNSITLTDRTTDFSLPNRICLDQSYDWSFEWRGKSEGANALFGSEGATTDFIYLAYGIGTSFGASYPNPFRMVDSSNYALMIPYGDYKDLNKEMHTWKVEYKASDRKLTLYSYDDTNAKWDTVGSFTATKNFTFFFTNLFGRYKEGTNVNYKGEVDYITITAKAEFKVG